MGSLPGAPRAAAWNRSWNSSRRRWASGARAERARLEAAHGRGNLMAAVKTAHQAMNRGEQHQRLAARGHHQNKAPSRAA